MSNTLLQQRLFAMQDATYAAFQSKLTPGIPIGRFIGVRVPLLRQFARGFAQESECPVFLQSLPHAYYDEDMLHSLLLSRIRDFDACVEAVNRFLPYVDNWAVCDILSPRIFARHHQELLPLIRQWIASSHVYTCRFGMGMLMGHFLDADFRPELLALPASVRSEEYYVRMMVAWFFATALAKQWDATIPYLERRMLDSWTHRKTIQKACESFRISPEQKEFLREIR